MAPHAKKRKRAGKLEKERSERYEKLVYQTRKVLHKEAKIVKSFECQKIIRKLKDADKGKDDKATARLAFVKGFPIDHIVNTCFQRLGIESIKPETKNEQQPPTTKATAKAEEEQLLLSAREKEFVEKCLKHKRISSAIDTCNDKIANYQKWNIRRQEGRPVREKSSDKKQRSDSALFVQLGEASDEEEENKDDNGEEEEPPHHYGPYREPTTPRHHYGPAQDVSNYRKNRPGQRARKAKAQAMEARQQGRRWDSSINWRPKKTATDAPNGGGGGKSQDNRQQQQQQQQRSKQQQQANQNPAQIAKLGKVWKEEGKEHPSWAAARQSQKTGIVQFTGKKITFD